MPRIIKIIVLRRVDLPAEALAKAGAAVEEMNLVIRLPAWMMECVRDNRVKLENNLLSQ